MKIGRRWAMLGAAGAIVGAAVWACADAVSPNTSLGLRVWAEVAPETVHVGDTSGLFVIRVVVSNPTSHLIRVKSGAPPFVFTADPAQSRGMEEQFRIACSRSTFACGPGSDYYGDSVYVFPPLDWYFAQDSVRLKSWTKGGYPLTPGTYTVRSWFNGHEGMSATLTLVP